MCVPLMCHLALVKRSAGQESSSVKSGDCNLAPIDPACNAQVFFFPCCESNIYCDCSERIAFQIALYLRKGFHSSRCSINELTGAQSLFLPIAVASVHIYFFSICLTKWTISTKCHLVWHRNRHLLLPWPASGADMHAILLLQDTQGLGMLEV